ncbi:MAG: DUF4912 domain-containing protein, partial [Myxococcales bacterium]|nr:DUF4912 domain-containing protein [Myxococcales bacterium]
MSKREELEQLERDDLEDAARRAGVARPEVLTRDEILDAMEALEERAAGGREGSKGFLSRVRQVLAAFVERGLNLPEAAERIRSGGTVPSSEPAMLPTVTLAEIYVAQGHTERALAVLDQILRSEPEHPGALRLRAKLQGQSLPPNDNNEDEDKDDDVTPQDESPHAPSINTASSISLATHPPPAKKPLSLIEASSAENILSTEDVSSPASLSPAGPPRPAPMLDEEPLPERYDVDELVLMPVDPTTLYLYWELRSETLEEALRLEPQGQLLLRLDQLVGDNYQTLRKMPVTFLGDTQVENLPPGALCVAVLGFQSESQWIPLLRSLPRALPPARGVAEVAHRVVRWTEAPSEEPPPPPPPTFALAVALRAPVPVPDGPSAVPVPDGPPATSVTIVPAPTEQPPPAEPPWGASFAAPPPPAPGGPRPPPGAAGGGAG